MLEATKYEHTMKICPVLEAFSILHSLFVVEDEFSTFKESVLLKVESSKEDVALFLLKVTMPTLLILTLILLRTSA